MNKSHRFLFSLTFIIFLGIATFIVYNAIQSRKIIRSKAESLGQNSIAYIGCSNTWQSVEGYHNVPGNKGLFWPYYDIGGGSVEQWASPNTEHWRRFDEVLTSQGQPQAVWIQLCEKDTRQVEYQAIVDAIENLKAKVVTRTFYISPLNSYTPSDICGKTGADGVARMTTYADTAADEGLAKRGPDLGPLTQGQTIDNCHPTEIARVDPIGKQLISFFDNLSTSQDTIPITGPNVTETVPSQFPTSNFTPMVTRGPTVTRVPNSTSTPTPTGGGRGGGLSPTPTPGSCNPDLNCGQAFTCVSGQCYPTTCGPANCDAPQGTCITSSDCGGVRGSPTPTGGVSPTSGVSPTGGVTQSPAPTGGTPTTLNPTFTVKASFQGITRKTPTDKMRVKLTLVSGSNKYEKDTEFTVDDAGVWTGTAAFTNVAAANNYYLLVKGPKHIQKRICVNNPSETVPGTYSCFQGAIPVQSSSLILNLSTIKLLAGDLPQQDSIVDSYDTSLVRNIVAQPVAERTSQTNLQLADINLDGIVDSQDFSLVIAALSIRSDEN